MDRVKLRYIPDPFKPSRYTELVIDAGGEALACAQEAFPELGDSPVALVRNCKRLKGDELLRDGDIMLVAIVPQASITAGLVVRWIVQALIAAAISYLVSSLTKPKPRSSNAKAASPSYSIQLDQNAARLGQIIPVVYGRVRLMPDIASQPYSEFKGNNERAYMILCMGMGEFTVHDVYVGESRVADLPTGNVQYWVIPPTGAVAHWQQLGHIEGQTGVNEDMVTIAESTGIDVQAPNDPSEAMVIATVSGGTLTPVDPGAWNVWAALVPGTTYNVTNSVGGGVAAIFLGIGANNSAVFDRALPTPTGVVNINRTAILAPYNDAAHGTMAYISTDSYVDLTVGELILVQWNGNTLGPFEVAERRPNSLAWNLYTSGAGWTSYMGPSNGIYPAQAVTIQRNAVVQWMVSEYVPGSNPAEPFRWLGWFLTGRSGTTTNKIFVDMTMPNGIAFISDKGNYTNLNVTFYVELQQVDGNGQPVGGIARFARTITGATPNARKQTWAFDVAVTRYRVRVCRVTERNQAASKEVSNANLFSVRFQVYHAPWTPAYENCTMLVMAFTAGSGLAAANNRRVTVDCTRKLPRLDGTYGDTSNPADILTDAYTNTEYGGARPIDELHYGKFDRLRAQWGTTAGFNAIYDSQITLIEAMQQMLNVVRAIPTPQGRLMSVTQDCPRTQDYVFDDSNTVNDSATIGYGFDGIDVQDCLEIVYTDPVTFTEARTYYPWQGSMPDTLELFGCTDKNQAFEWGRIVWQDRQWNRKTCELEVEGEGYLLGPLSRFGLTIPSLQVETSGRVTNVSGRVVELDTPLAAGVNVISFVGDDAKISPLVGIGMVNETRLVVTLASDPPIPLYLADNTRDATVFRAAIMNQEYFSFQVVNIDTSSAMRVRVSGKQYNAAVYNGTFVEYWITGD